MTSTLPSGGVNLYVLANSILETIVPSGPYPIDLTSRPPVPPRFYSEGIWSPDDPRLLIQFGDYLQCGGRAVKSLSDGTTVELVSAGGITCCNPAWSAGAQTIDGSTDSIGLVSAGLWRVPASTGQTVALISSAGG